jgi:Domain of unknown function (DUF4157)
MRQAARVPVESSPAQVVQARRRVAAAQVADDVRSALATSGRPLDPPVREQMEHRFRWDFSRVRIHGDDVAARSARGLGAAAYTVGSQVVFGAGYRGAATPGGQRLLAHELAHVVQQGGTRARPHAVGPLGGVHEAEAERAAAGRAARLGAVPPGTIQRSPLSDRVRAAAGPAPTLTSVLAALSGDDVQVPDPDLDQAISQMLGGRAEDIALAQQVRSRVLGTTTGWAGPKGKGPKTRRSITVRYFPGRTTRRALVIAGVHGSEVQGMEVAQQLISDLADARNQPEMSAVIVPVLFPDDAAFRDREGPGAHPNRNFPEPSRDLAASGPDPKDALGKPIRPENVMLMQLMERFAPERIISIHGTWDPKKAGVSYDPRALTAAEDARARAWGVNPASDESNAPAGLVRARRAGFQRAATEQDNRLSLDAADLIDKRTRGGAGPTRGGLAHPSVAGNFKGGSTTPNFARWEGGMDEGVSLGGYASQRGISIFTVEPPEDKKIDEFTGKARTAREVEIKAYAEAVRTILLGS